MCEKELKKRLNDIYDIGASAGWEAIFLECWEKELDLDTLGWIIVNIGEKVDYVESTDKYISFIYNLKVGDRSFEVQCFEGIGNYDSSIGEVYES